MRLRYLSALIVALSFAGTAANAQFFNDYDQPPHDYWNAEMKDPMTRLLQRVERNEAKMPEENGRALVDALLEQLDIPVESQVLVFSRTSLQRGAVSPENPRAIYFNDETYLGWMPGGRIEIASIDPDLGAVFHYQRKLDTKTGARFVRDKVCLQCHAGSATNFLPGLLGRSVYPDARGRSLKAIESFERVGHEVALDERWGGWYVTGGHDGLTHMGNAFGLRGEDGVQMNRSEHAALSDLSGRVDVANYPRGGSDIVPLLVLDHQISMHFKLMEANYMARQIAADGAWADGVVPDELPADISKEVALVADKVTAYLLFQNEAPLGEQRIEGSAEYKDQFLAGRKQDEQGRSLRDFRLEGHLFEHRCSFMIHSKTFKHLHPLMKSAVFTRLKEILGADAPEKGYEYLTAAERHTIVQILSQTVPEFVD